MELRQKSWFWDDFLVSRLLGFDSVYISAIDNVLSDLNEASGPVAIRD